MGFEYGQLGLCIAGHSTHFSQKILKYRVLTMDIDELDAAGMNRPSK
jgi:hypothetical protein